MEFNPTLCLLLLTGMTGASTTRIINELLKLYDADCKQHANRNSQPVPGQPTQPSTQIPSGTAASLQENQSQQSTPLSPQQNTPPTSKHTPLAPISCTALGLRAAHSIGLLPYLFPKVYDHLVSEFGLEYMKLQSGGLPCNVKLLGLYIGVTQNSGGCNAFIRLYHATDFQYNLPPYELSVTLYSIPTRVRVNCAGSIQNMICLVGLIIEHILVVV